VEEDPLMMDFDFEGLHRLEGIPIETLGVHSYRTSLKFKEKSSLTIDKQIGVICTIKMDGSLKRVQLESQVLFANNLNRPVSIFV